MKAMLGVNFSKFFFRSFCSQDGFLTLREGEAALSNSGTCILTLVFMHLTLLSQEEKCSFLCLNSPVNYCWGSIGGLYRAILGEFFEVFFSAPFRLGIGF